jgi:phosphatidate phosphatase APP1
MRPVFISDIDGTVANIEHRLHFIKGKDKDWDCFFAACPDDAPIPETIELLKLLSRANLSLINSPKIIYITGRDENTRTETQNWLNRNGCPVGPLYMRKSGDHRPDDVIKSEILDKLLNNGLDKESILGVFEDRANVVKMWRKRGLKVYQVNEGDF